MKYVIACSAIAIAAAASCVHAIEAGQLDDFDASPGVCELDSWGIGLNGLGTPLADAQCGELGSCCMRSIALGGFGPGSRQVVLNETQWSGDYVAAGVNRIDMLAANASDTEDLFLRVGITNGLTCYVSTEAVTLAAATPGPDGLVNASFLLDESTLTEVAGNNCGSGGQSVEQVLSGVIQLRLLSSAVPTWLGDAIASELQIDSISANGDVDLDGIGDNLDNCTNVANPDQTDGDADGYGNACDADLSNDCVVNTADLVIFRGTFFTSDPVADFNSDGTVNVADLNVLRLAFFGMPGPGLGDCDN